MAAKKEQLWIERPTPGRALLVVGLWLLLLAVVPALAWLRWHWAIVVTWVICTTIGTFVAACVVHNLPGSGRWIQFQKYAEYSVYLLMSLVYLCTITIELQLRGIIDIFGELLGNL